VRSGSLLRMSRELGSASVPPLGPRDHVHGELEEEGGGTKAHPFPVVVYAEYTCPHCALLHERLRGRGVTLVHRHFALRSRPRAIELACAAEAAGAQGSFWAMHDSLLADQGHQDDPHLWARATALGLDVERFEHDRRAPQTLARVREDVDGALRAGIAATPTLVIDGRLHAGPLNPAALDELLGVPAR
jgi:protein-disulfide isomerase